MPWLLIGGGVLAAIVLLRSTSQANNTVNQTYTKSAGTMVPFVNAGGAGTPTATGPILVGATTYTEQVGSWNKNFTNGNGQPVSPPSANVINAGAQTAVAAVNIANASQAAQLEQSTFWYKDPVSGVDSLGYITDQPIFATSGKSLGAAPGTGWWAWTPSGVLLTTGMLSA